MCTVWWWVMLFLLHTVGKGATRTLPLSPKHNNLSRNSVAVETKSNMTSSVELPSPSNLTSDSVATATEGNMTSSVELPSPTNLTSDSVATATEGNMTSSVELPSPSNLTSDSVATATKGNTTFSVELPTSTTFTVDSISMATVMSEKVEIKGNRTSEQLPTSATLTTVNSVTTRTKEVDLFMRLNLNFPHGPMEYDDIILPPGGSHSVFDSPDLTTDCEEGFVRIRNICRRVIQT